MVKRASRDARMAECKRLILKQLEKANKYGMPKSRPLGYAPGYSLAFVREAANELVADGIVRVTGAARGERLHLGPNYVRSDHEHAVEEPSKVVFDVVSMDEAGELDDSDFYGSHNEETDSTEEQLKDIQQRAMELAMNAESLLVVYQKRDALRQQLEEVENEYKRLAATVLKP